MILGRGPAPAEWIEPRIEYPPYAKDAALSATSFAVVGGEKMNKNIKEIAKMLGFTREVEVMQYCGKTDLQNCSPM